MVFFKIVVITIALLQCISAKGIGFGGIGGGLGGYGGGGAGGSGGNIGGGYGGGYGGGIGGGYGSWGAGEISQPRPYSTGFQAPDGQGGGSFRTEQGDGSGNVRGSYGYRDAQGLYRKVEYSAGPAGFSAAVDTNEPGVDGKENPADVSMNVAKTPAGIQERYTRPAGSGAGGRGGWGAGSMSGGFGGLGGLSGISSGGYGGTAGIGSGGYDGMGFTGITRGGMGVRSGKSGY